MTDRNLETERVLDESNRSNEVPNATKRIEDGQNLSSEGGNQSEVPNDAIANRDTPFDHLSRLKDIVKQLKRHISKEEIFDILNNMFDNCSDD